MESRTGYAVVGLARYPRRQNEAASNGIDRLTPTPRRLAEPMSLSDTRLRPTRNERLCPARAKCASLLPHQPTSHQQYLTNKHPGVTETELHKTSLTETELSDMTKMDLETMNLVAAYTRPVTRCRPGRARAPAERKPMVNKAVAWLKEHRVDKPVKNAKAVRKRLKRASSERERMARRNAAIRTRIGES
jgi:hypothetical protein